MISNSSRQYIRRLLGYLGHQDPIRVMRNTPKKIQTLLGRIPAEALLIKLSPASWSIAEIVAHLAETELVLGWRYRSIAERNGIAIQSFDQDIWSRNARYALLPVKKSLEMFSILRAMNLTFLAGLPASTLSNYGMHEERGKETLRHIIRLEAGHDINHVKQIQKILRSVRTATRTTIH